MSSSSSGRRRGLPLQRKMKHDNHFVDELITRHAEPVGKMVLLAEVEPDPDQPRSSLGELDDLKRSIQDKGVLEPILVRPLDENPAEPERESVRYRIISGERRYRAAAEAGLYEIPVIEMDVDETEALEIALIENLQRKDLTPFEEADGYQALAMRHDYTHAQIADAVGKARTVVTEAFGLLQLSPRVRAVADALGIESKTVLREVLKADGEDAQIELLEAVARHGLSRDDLRAAAKTRGRAQKPHRKPHTFRFKSPDKTYTLALTFRKDEVDKSDLIDALESILADLREEGSASTPN